MVSKVLFSSANEVWATPQDFFDKLNDEFNFTLDPCALPDNAKCKNFFTPEDDGLSQNWGGADCVLQSTLRTKDWRLGKEMLRGISEARHNCCNAHSCTDRYGMVSRLRLRKSGNQIHSRSFEVRRYDEFCTIPFNGSNLSLN